MNRPHAPPVRRDGRDRPSPRPPSAARRQPHPVRSIAAWGSRPAPRSPAAADRTAPPLVRPDGPGPAGPPPVPGRDPPGPRRYRVVSAEDHLLEPPDLFEGRLPPEVARAAPRLAEVDDEGCWVLDRARFSRSDPPAGCDPEGAGAPGPHGDLRRGCFDVHARIEDMDEAGVWASLCLPTRVAVFAERLFAASFHPTIGLAIVRAYNDWVCEEWCGAYPERLVPCGLTHLADSGLGAAEVYRNARRGFRAVVLPARPHRRGLPSVFSGHWDPIVDACEDTETAIVLRAGAPPALAPDGPSEVLSGLAAGHDAPVACAEWLVSGIPVRFPEARFVVAEAGIGWVPELVDRLMEIAHHLGEGGEVVRGGAGLDSVDVLHRNFWFTTTGDPSTIALRSVIGADHIVTALDYPGIHSTWPDTQAVLDRAWGQLPADEVAKLTYANACHLLRWPAPDAPPSPG